MWGPQLENSFVSGLLLCVVHTLMNLAFFWEIFSSCLCITCGSELAQSSHCCFNCMWSTPYGILIFSSFTLYVSNTLQYPSLNITCDSNKAESFFCSSYIAKGFISCRNSFTAVSHCTWNWCCGIPLLLYLHELWLHHPEP